MKSIPRSPPSFNPFRSSARALTRSWPGIRRLPADAALMMQLGCDGVFVGSGIFKSATPAEHARAIVKATAYFNDPTKVLEASLGLGKSMPGLEISAIPKEQLLAGRGW